MSTLLSGVPMSLGRSLAYDNDDIKHVQSRLESAANGTSNDVLCSMSQISYDTKVKGEELTTRSIRNRK